MKKPRVLVFAGYGLNCEEETKYAFELAGGKAEVAHVNDVTDSFYNLKSYQIIAIPGGFAYGDDTGSGNAYALKIKNSLWEQLSSFISRDTLIIGICNGFQILVNLGLLPALNRRYGERQVALIHNDSARYCDRWVDIEVHNHSPWLKGMKNFSLPIAHGEGKLYANSQTLKLLNKNNVVALRYTLGEVCTFQNLPKNPNGSSEDIAGITDETGRIFGLMPHPERAMFFHQLPYWTFIKEQLERKHKKIPFYGPGLQIFKNAVDYFDY